MTYKVGTRVKKVRNINKGLTGVVVNGPDHYGLVLDGVFDVYIRMDWPFIRFNRTDNSFIRIGEAGEVVRSNSCDWEPILLDGLECGPLSAEELLESIQSGCLEAVDA